MSNDTYEAMNYFRKQKNVTYIVVAGWYEDDIESHEFAIAVETDIDKAIGRAYRYLCEVMCGIVDVDKRDSISTVVEMEDDAGFFICDYIIDKYEKRKPNDFCKIFVFNDEEK